MKCIKVWFVVCGHRLNMGDKTRLPHVDAIVPRFGNRRFLGESCLHWRHRLTIYLDHVAHRPGRYRWRTKRWPRRRTSSHAALDGKVGVWWMARSVTVQRQFERSPPCTYVLTTLFTRYLKSMQQASRPLYNDLPSFPVELLVFLSAAEVNEVPM